MNSQHPRARRDCEHGPSFGPAHWLCTGALALSACASPVAQWEPTWQSPGASTGPLAQEGLRTVRALADGEQWAEAIEVLVPLVGAAPENLDLGCLLQDLERAQRAASGSPGDGGESARASAVELAQREPTCARLVLVARLFDGEQSLEWLDQALALDHENPWAHYARAQVLLGERLLAGRWGLARAALDEALRLDPNHLRARHLEAWMFAQEGDVERAAEALEQWLENTSDDPRVGRVQRVEAEVDLAMMWVRLGLPEEAEELLETQAGESIARGRRLAVLTVAQHEQGRLDDALDSARRAQLADPDALLPLVHQALVLGQRDLGGDHEGADDLWSQVVEAAALQKDLAGLLQSVRARMYLERGPLPSDRSGERKDSKSAGAAGEGP